MPLPEDVLWTDEIRERFHPGRGGSLPAAPKRRPTAGKLLRDVVNAANKHTADWDFDARVIPDGWADAWAAARAQIASPDPKAPLDLETEMIVYRFVASRRWQDRNKPTQTPKIVRRWYWTGGAAFAVQALASASEWGFVGRRQEDVTTTTLERRPPDWGGRSLDIDKRDGPAISKAFLELRSLLALASDEDYAAAVAAGEAARAEASPVVRCWLTFAMPDQGEWAAAEALAMLEMDEAPPHRSLIVGALDDVDLALRLVAHPRAQGGLLQILARHGAAAAPAIQASCVAARAAGDYSTAWGALDALALVPDPTVAAYLVDVYASGSKYEKKRAEPFFQRAPAIALAALQAAVGAHPELADKIAEILRANPDLDPSAAPQAAASDLPAALQGAPEGAALDAADWDPGTLPVVRLAGAEMALPPDAMTRLGQLLRDSAGRRSPALDEALAALEPADRDALAEALWLNWEQGANRWQVFLAARKWLGLAQGLLGGDATARRVGRAVRQWSGQRYNQGRACLLALRTIGTDAALLQLQDLSQRAKSKGIKREAASTLAAAAKDRGLSAAELADRLVPTLDLETPAGWTFDYGPRSFTLVLSRQLKPSIRDGAGKIRTGLPRANSKDDKAKAKAANARWRDVKKALREAAPGLLTRLEAAMIGGICWSAADWQARIAGHPLTGAIAAGLVWSDSSAQTFTLVDGAAADASGAAVTPRGEVMIAHPAAMEPATLDAWRAALPGLQPFQQLERRVFSPGSPQTADVVDAWEHMPPRFIRGLIGRGWTRGPVEDNGFFKSVSRSAGGATVTIGFDEGLNVSSAMGDPASLEVEIDLTGGSAGVGFSELVRDLAP